VNSRERLEQYFKDHGVSFNVTPHAEVYTAQEVAAVEHVPGMYVAKVVMAMLDGKSTMLVLPAPFRVDIPRLKAALRAHDGRLATEDEFGGLFPDCEVGAMPPFGNLYDVPVVVDRRLTEDPKIVFKAGNHRETMTIAYADYDRLVHPAVAEFTQSR
jgi:Ala-tRNA(Pro) deacylase